MVYNIFVLNVQIYFFPYICMGSDKKRFNFKSGSPFLTLFVLTLCLFLFIVSTKISASDTVWFAWRRLSEAVCKGYKKEEKYMYMIKMQSYCILIILLSLLFWFGCTILNRAPLNEKPRAYKYIHPIDNIVHWGFKLRVCEIK